MLKKIDIYTDGACSGNPGAGGYAAILRYRDREKVLSGGYKCTTNNRMELLAVIEALSALKEKCEVTLYTDSKYVADAISKGWVYSWKAKGWKKADGKPALNRDLWERLLELLSKHEVKFEWVKGHSENEYNNLCDKLAVEASKNPTFIDKEYEGQGNE